jgi:predicted MFS family arabinose efflux permease
MSQNISSSKQQNDRLLSLIRHIKNYYFFITIVSIQIIALIGLFLAESPLLIKVFFIIYQSIPPLLLFSLDIFLERMTIRQEGKTGSIHSLYLTVQNTAYVFSPFIVGSIVMMSSFRSIYAISAFFCCILLFLALDEFRIIKTRPLHEVNFVDSLKKFTRHLHLNRLFVVSFLLHSFYAGMVIYMPLYLHEYIGFDWSTIGLMFTIMLIPFVIFETPLGRLFDRAHTEKDTIIAGFLIISFATLSMFFLHSANVILWTSLLFTSRIGASFVEVGSEYSFFKRVSDQDAGFISIFRMAGPVAYSIAPFVTSSIIRQGLPLQYIFFVISCVVLTGIVFTYRLNTLRS